MEYEKETLLEIDSLAIKEFRAKKTLWERSNELLASLKNLESTIWVSGMILYIMGVYFGYQYLSKDDNLFTTSGSVILSFFLLINIQFLCISFVANRIPKSNSWIYRYLKKPKALVEIDSLREEWNQALADFSPLLQDERVQFEILKNLNTKCDWVCVSFKPEYERLIGWLKHYLKYKEYQQATVTLLSIYELLEKQSANAKDGDYYNELNKKFTVPGLDAKL